MKHEKTETITTTVVSYSCDICKKELILGMRPYLCVVCAREICIDHTHCFRTEEFNGTVMRVCQICSSLVHFPLELEALYRNVESQEMNVFAAWKEASLEKDNEL